MRTPRTDAGTKHLSTWWSDSEPGDTEMVKAELARQLETELAAMTKAKDQWQGMFHEVVKQRDTEREKVAKLEDIIRSASTKFWQDGPDGEIAAAMFRILGEALNETK